MPTIDPAPPASRAHPPEPVRPPFPSLGQALLLLLLIQLIANSVGFVILLPTILGDLLRHGGLTRPIDPAGLGIVANSLAFGSVIWLALRLSGLRGAEAFPLRAVRWSAWPGIVLGLAGGIAVVNEISNLMIRLLPPPEIVTDMFRQFMKTGGAGAVSLVFLALVAPITEEFFFRGVLLSSFTRRFGVRRAVVGSAVLFGLVHILPWQVVPAVVLGLLFAWWTVRFQSLWPALLGHAVNNGASFFVGLSQPDRDPLAVTPQPAWVTLGGLLALGVGLWLSTRNSPGAPRPESLERSLP